MAGKTENEHKFQDFSPPKNHRYSGFQPRQIISAFYLDKVAGQSNTIRERQVLSGKRRANRWIQVAWMTC
jgi:hypothetical protein